MHEINQINIEHNVPSVSIASSLVAVNDTLHPNSHCGSPLCACVRSGQYSTVHLVSQTFKPPSQIFPPSLLFRRAIARVEKEIKKGDAVRCEVVVTLSLGLDT